MAKKSIVVTGGSKGIGRAIIDKFASEGFDIITCSRNEEELLQLKTEVESAFKGIQVFFKKADLSDRQEIKDFVEFVGSLGNTIQILVNNAGFFLPGQIHNEAEGTLEKMIETNLYSAYHVTRGLIHQMKERKEGFVFNICSTASIIPYTNGGSYCIAKFALYGMSKVLREEMKDHGVKVTSVLPGATLTASWAGVDLPEERFMKSADVAESIWAAYSLSKNSVVEEILIRPQLGDI